MWVPHRAGAPPALLAASPATLGARCCGLETRQDLAQETPQDDPVAAWRGSCWDPLPTPIGLQQC